jgi:hypothetical protein
MAARGLEASGAAAEKAAKAMAATVAAARAVVGSSRRA